MSVKATLLQPASPVVIAVMSLAGAKYKIARQVADQLHGFDLH